MFLVISTNCTDLRTIAIINFKKVFNMNKLLSALLLITVICNSCKKDSSTSSQKLEDQLSKEQLLILEAAPLDITTKYTDLVFPDGRNISEWGYVNDTGVAGVFSIINSAPDKKDLFIKKMSEAGCDLTDDPQCSCYPNQPNGLAYVYGSKRIKSTLNPLHPDAKCRLPFFGLDCSGMIYQMAIKSGLLLIPSGTIDYIKPSVWNTAFNTSSDFQGLEMKDLSYLPASQFQAGDIIVKSEAHIGMVYSTGSTLGILNSQGSSGYTCEQNSELGRGPVKRSDPQAWIGQLFPHNDYHVLRVILIGTPGLTTNNVSSISQTSAVCGGNITNQGGSPVIARGVCWSITPEPTIANSKTSDGIGTGSFTSSITGLTASTLYYVRAYATNSGGTSYGNQMNFNTTQSGSSNTVTDIDGNVYNTVTIGTQVWMKENLKVSRYRNGNSILTGLSDAQWGSTTSGAFSVYNNNSANNNTYGKLYNWYAVNDSRKIAPVGWHVPTDAEWDILINYLGGTSVAGGKLKAVSPLWGPPNNGATNSSGFTGLPGGGRDDGKLFNSTVKYTGLGAFGYWWSATENNNPAQTAWDHSAYASQIYSFPAYDSKGFGFSVRCVKD